MQKNMNETVEMKVNEMKYDGLGSCIMAGKSIWFSSK